MRSSFVKPLKEGKFGLPGGNGRKSPSQSLEAPLDGPCSGCQRRRRDTGYTRSTTSPPGLTAETQVQNAAAPTYEPHSHPTAEHRFKGPRQVSETTVPHMSTSRPETHAVPYPPVPSPQTLRPGGGSLLCCPALRRAGRVAKRSGAGPASELAPPPRFRSRPRPFSPPQPCSGNVP